MGKTIITIVAELLVALAFLVGRISGERQSIPAPVALESPAPLTLEALSQQEALTGEAVRQEEKISAPASSKATAIPNAPSTTEIKKEISPPTTFLVTRVIDGDTVELESGERVRYIGIDTPESVDPRKPIECFGKEAVKENEKLAAQKRVTLKKDVTDKDRYGRLLRYVYINGVFINLELIRTGYASVYTYPPDVKYNAQFLAAQEEARSNQRGLWSACKEAQEVTIVQSPTPPQETKDQPQAQSSGQQDNPPPSPTCDIKGNINSKGEKIYHLPGCQSYNKTKIDINRGEHFFCSENEARDAGWRKALNCPE